MTRKIFKAGALAALAAALLLSLASCRTSISEDSDGSGYKDFLYMTDTVSGNVYAYDPAEREASSSIFASVTKKAAGEIQFFMGIGYAAVGYGTGEGVYYFDPSAKNPTFKKLGDSIAAQYFAFASTTKAYVSAFDYSGPTSGLYSFNPVKPGSGLKAVAAASGLLLQELVIAADGYLYAADNGNGNVLKIDTSSDTIASTISTGTTGTTGLCAGTYNGSDGVFVANTSGSIGFVDSATSAYRSVTSASIFPGRVLQLPNGKLAATGYDPSYVNHSYLVTLSGASAAVTELKSRGGNPFGSLDIAYKDGLVYVPVAETSDYVSYKNSLYVFDASGKQASFSPVSVMKQTDGISNIGFYE
jgi:hypothetical protein